VHFWQIAREREEATMLDRRKTQRLRSFKGGQIVFNRHWPEIDCTVRNMTHAGALLELQGEYNTSLEFELTFLQDNERRTCRQVWRQGTKLGVAFA
jgi:hypothetical protein